MSRKGYGDRIAERHAQVIGDGSRIAALDDSEMSAESRQIVDEVRASAGAGPAVVVPEYMRIIAKHPRLFRGQMETGTLFFQGMIPPRERELAVLRIGWLAGAPYEWSEHVRISQRYGVTPEEIERAKTGSSAPGWSEHDGAILRGVEELLEDFAISGETWEVLARTWDEPQMLEFPAMVGQYIAIAFIQNSIRMPPGPDLPGLLHR